MKAPKSAKQFRKESGKKKDECLYLGYYDITPTFGDIIHEEDFGDYSGDTLLVLKNNNRFGYLRFGWGSCSGCDALEACSTDDEYDAIIDLLWESVVWFDSKEEIISWLNQHDWEGDWLASEAEEFVPSAIRKIELSE